MPNSAYAPGVRTTPSRHPERVSYDRERVHTVLDAALFSHVGFVTEGHPVVLPMLHVRLGEALYLHGSTGARALRAACGQGLDVCVTTTVLDALVLARSACHHSVNYRSVVAHGPALVVEDDHEKNAALLALVDAVVPGRSGATRPPSRHELAATTVLRLWLESVSFKSRSGPPVDDPADLDLQHWAGILPLAIVSGAPEPAADLRLGVETPNHLRAWSRF